MAAALLQERIPPISLMLGCFAVTVVLFMVVSFPPSPAIGLAAAVVAGFTGSCLWATMLAIAADAYPQGGATMFAVLTAFGNAGCSLVPWLVGLITAQSDIHIGLLAVAVCPAGMMVLLVWMSRWSRRNTLILSR